MGGLHPLAQYLQLVRERIASCKKYPPLARRRQLEGRVGIRFLLAGTGGAQEIRVSASSGQEILDRAAIRAVQDAAPFPPPPAGLLAGAVVVELNIVFNLS
ncbi:energy transducer TonB [Thiovibrio sp. JS02]